MKLSDILAEMPTNLNKDAPFVFNIDGSYISNSSLDRNFELMGEISIDSTPFKFWLSKRVNRALVTTQAEDGSAAELRDGDKNPTNLIAVDLHLKQNSIVVTPNPIQVDTVSVNSGFESIGLSGVLYVVISRHGYSVISDFEQYRGGVGLWQKIARLSKSRRYIVKIWNIRDGDWLKDSKGNPIEYDEQNLTRDQVWNTIGQQVETLLVLSSK